MNIYQILKRTGFTIIFIVPVLLIAQPQRNTVVSPEILADHSVIFRVFAPYADTIKLRGTMIADFSELAMEKNDSGIFEIQIGPLTPDIYVYTFRVDGVVTLDPSNNIVVRDGSYIESRLLLYRDRPQYTLQINVCYGYHRHETSNYLDLQGVLRTIPVQK